jgi:hypothetical protein
VLYYQKEITVVGDEDGAVAFPVPGYLFAFGGGQGVIVEGFGFDNASEIAGGGLYETEVGVAGAGIGELVGGLNIGVEFRTDGVQEVFERGAVGKLGGATS